MVSEFAILAQKWYKVALPKRVDFWVFAKHPAVHRGKLPGGGSVAVAVGVSDMQQVTGDTGYGTHET